MTPTAAEFAAELRGETPPPRLKRQRPAVEPAPDTLPTPVQQLAARELLRRQNALGGMVAFREYVQPSAHKDFEFAPAAHHQVIIAALERLERGDTRRLLVCAPPGSAKSTYTSVQFACWYLARQELGNWASLHDDFIVPLIKIARLEFSLAAMMEIMPGSLADYLRQHPVVNPLAVREILLDVSRGLAYAHEAQHLVHLDLKPENLLLRAANSPRVKIADWGLAHIMSAHPTYANWWRDPKVWMTRQIEEKTQFCGGYPAIYGSRTVFWLVAGGSRGGRILVGDYRHPASDGLFADSR